MKTTNLLNDSKVLLMTASLSLTALGCAAAGFGAADLRCEYGRNPAAIGETQPRLSWIVQTAPEQRGVAQGAYQVLVAASQETLDKDQGDLWDSGKVDSAQSVNVLYGGRQLNSTQPCFWKVKLWDQQGAASPWSPAATWTMGLLQPSDWQAKWIGFDAPPAESDSPSAVLKRFEKLDANVWVWANGSTPGDQPPGKVYFRKVIELPADRNVTEAAFLLAADDSFKLYVNGHMAGQGNTFKNVSVLDVGGRLKPGANALAIEAVNGGDQPNPAGVIGHLVVAFANGDPMVVPVDESWQTSRQRPKAWTAADFAAADWRPAAVVGKYGDSPWGPLEAKVDVMSPAPYFRKTFVVSKDVARAIVFASALGVYELHLNGSPVSNDVLSPGWTDYRQRVHYFGYDVTSRLKQGDNTLGAILGDGWYSGYLAFTGKRHYYGDKPRLRVQLQIEYRDGSKEILGTDASWKAATGPILEGDLLMGCVYDTRKELGGWDAPDYPDAAWRPATVDEQVQANCQAHPGSPIRPEPEIPARKLSEPKPGVYVFDLGQNMVGWARVKLQGKPGQKIVVRHAEMLNADGTLYTTNLRAARATDTYYLADGPKRVFQPYFTFHGFQYVEITGLDYKPDLDDVAGVPAHSDLPQTAWFECSEPLVNKLVLNSLWGQKGNFLDVPTDCPQRDERAGWTGDAQVFMKTACLNLDAPGFYTKWLVDLCDDSQRPDGAFGDVAPHISIVGFGNTGWSDSGPVCNWRMYEMYGDTRVVDRHYEELVKYMGYLDRTSKGLVRGTFAYGDWLRLAGPQHSDAIGTAYYFYIARLMSTLADALDKKEDAMKYRDLAEAIRAVYVKTFIKDDGRIVDAKGETGQTFYALAFGLGLVPEELKSQVADQFVASIRKQDDHLATGFLGTPFVLFALQKAGHPELAYKLVLNKTYPSWLQQVLWGSTTMWERWDGWRPDKGFQDPGMNSFNHYWLGCVSEWLFTQAAGIDTDGPGFQRITLRPEIVKPEAGFSWVKASYHSIRGTIASDWKLDQDRFQWNVTVPGNSTATVYVPASSAADVTESGKPATEAPGVKFLRQDGRRAVFEIGSGQYAFQSGK